jgi:hypothetical protein
MNFTPHSLHIFHLVITFETDLSRVLGVGSTRLVLEDNEHGAETKPVEEQATEGKEEAFIQLLLPDKLEGTE